MKRKDVKKHKKMKSCKDEMYSLHKDSLREQVKSFMKPELLVEKAKKKDGRSPEVNEIISKKYKNTGGMHPVDARVLKQVRELNGKSKVKIVPLQKTKITSPKKMIRESVSTLDILMDVIRESKKSLPSR